MKMISESLNMKKQVTRNRTKALSTLNGSNMASTIPDSFEASFSRGRIKSPDKNRASMHDTSPDLFQKRNMTQGKITTKEKNQTNLDRDNSTKRPVKRILG